MSFSLLVLVSILLLQRGPDKQNGNSSVSRVLLLPWTASPLSRYSAKQLLKN